MLEKILYNYNTRELLELKTELSKKYDTNISLAKIGDGLTTVLVVDLKVSVVVEVGILNKTELDTLLGKLVIKIKEGDVQSITEALENIIWNFHQILCIKDNSDKLMMFWNAWENVE